ncbi:MAG: hypothetical protein WBM13_06010 [Bacteroidia bacterium]
MKNKLLIALLTALFCIPQITEAQFIFLGANNGQTTPAIRGIGIGDFSGNGATSPSARLHVNNFFCNQPNGSLSGLLFRTDGRNNVENQW